MDIYIPKFKDIFMTQSSGVGLTSRFKGEYRVELRGADGRIKYETDWKPNTLLNYGIWLLTYSSQSFNTFADMVLGTGSTAVNITDINLSGTQLGEQNGVSSISGVNAGAPNYERITVMDYRFDPGRCTGTITEFGLTNYGGDNPANLAVRVVLDVPIVKGASDQLNIQHRLTWYPQLTDATGVITIGGDVPEDYNYTMRHTMIGATPGIHPTSIAPHFWASRYDLYISTALSANTTNPQAAGVGSSMNGGYGASSISLSQKAWDGTAGPYYCDATATWTVNAYGTGECNMLNFGMHCNQSWAANIGMQSRFTKVSDGSNLIKLNTHELKLTVRTYAERYVP